MVNINYLKARVKRNNLEVLAGRHYRDEASQIVKTLKGEGKDALLGIQRKDGVYTIIGEQSIYYTTPDGDKGQILLKDFSNRLHENGLRKGRLFGIFKYKYLKIENDHKVWLKNMKTMCALWNTLLWLEDLMDVANPKE